MDPGRLLQIPGEVLARVSAAPEQDLLPWQLPIVVLTFIAASLLAWKLHPQRDADTTQTKVGMRAAIAERLLPAGVFCAVSLLAWAVLGLAGESAALLVGAIVLGLVMLLVRGGLLVIAHKMAALRDLSRAERVTGWVLWALIVLFLSRQLQPVVEAVDSIVVPLGKSRISLLDALRVMFVLLLFVFVATWLGAVMERRMLRSSSLPIGIRVGVAKVTRVLLVLVALDAAR